MGALQPGLPSPVAIPANHAKIIIDLKDCFFTIPLHPQDKERFAFSLPVINFKGPMPRYQWKVLPQGMANSPTLCQKFVAQAVDPLPLGGPLFTSSITWTISFWPGHPLKRFSNAAWNLPKILPNLVSKSLLIRFKYKIPTIILASNSIPILLPLKRLC